MLKFLIDNGANINAIDNNNNDALNVAVAKGNFLFFKNRNERLKILIAFPRLDKIDAAVFLLENRADPNVGRYNENTALSNAVFKSEHSFELLKNIRTIILKKLYHLRLFVVHRKRYTCTIAY